MEIQSLFLSIFAVIVVGFLVVDLGFLNRKAHRIGFKSALLQSIFWVVLAVLFGLAVLIFMDKTMAVEFFSAYVTEKMLSVDNLFVILLIFSFFKLDEKYYHRVLFWGILGAIIFRGIFISLGALIVERFHFVLYIFGAILLYTGFKLFFETKEKHQDFHNNSVLKFFKKYFPFTLAEHHGKFFIKEGGKWHATVLFMIIILVESTDIIFAVDSIPAAFAISQSLFILFTSNVFAIMGLRALFFLIENVIHKFHHLQKGLAFILVFVGGKMFLGIFNLHFSSVISFTIIMSILGLSLLSSVMFPKKLN
jgi:tellurite resistance protein TerC